MTPKINMNVKKFHQYCEKIKAVLNYIDHHVTDTISLTKIANVAEFSDHHFHRIFKQIVGENIKHYIRRLRIEKATKLLLTTKKNIHAVSRECGFLSHETFIRAFKKQYGAPPSKKRKIIQEKVDSYLNLSIPLYDESLKYTDYQKINTNVEITEINDIQVNYTRIIERYNDTSTLWMTLLNESGSDVFFDDESKFYGVHNDIPGITKPEQCRFDACIHTPYTLNMQKKTIKGGLYAYCKQSLKNTTIHKITKYVLGSWLPHTNYVFNFQPIHYIILNMMAITREYASPEIGLFIPITHKPKTRRMSL